MIPSVPQKTSDEKLSMLLRLASPWRWLEKSGLWLENVDRTHLVPTSGRLVLQKIYCPKWIIVQKHSKAVAQRGPFKRAELISLLGQQIVFLEGKVRLEFS